MSTTLALHWNETALHYVVACAGKVTVSESLALTAGWDATALGQRLADSLAAHSLGRAKVIVALGRGDLEWQHLSLPPCPADELTDLVQMQADRDFGSADENLGFDYFSLAGNEETPYQVLTVALEADRLAKIREVCQAANLTLDRLVPLALGWPAVAAQTTSNSSSHLQIFVAPQAHEATLWATQAGQVTLFRQFQLAANADPAALAKAVNNELRRTLLTLSQQTGNKTPTISLVGHQQESLLELAAALDAQLDTDSKVQALGTAPAQAGLELKSVSLALAGLAVDGGQGKSPLVDLLHPRRRPQAKVNTRTYVLAATAGALVLGLLGWTGYTNLQAPLDQAASDRQELKTLEESLDDLEVFEEHAASIRNWQLETPNLLLHLQQVSQCLRPEPLDAKSFSIDQDILLERFDLQKRNLTISARAHDAQAVRPLESRLQAIEYRAVRGKSSTSDKLQGYPWEFKSTIVLTPDSDYALKPPADSTETDSTETNDDDTKDRALNITAAEPSDIKKPDDEKTSDKTPNTTAHNTASDAPTKEPNS